MDKKYYKSYPQGRIYLEMDIFVIMMIGLFLGILIAMAWNNHEMKKTIKPVVQPISTYKTPDPCDLPYIQCHNQIYAKVTKYTKIETCPNRQCQTANGEIPAKDLAVACPRNIPLGTNIKIGERTLRCTDRTSRQYNGRFDIYHGSTQKDYREAIQYGIHEEKVTILE